MNVRDPWIVVGCLLLLSSGAAYGQTDDELPIVREQRGMLAPFGVGPIPILDCAPLRVCVLELGEGETLAFAAAGDQVQWVVDGRRGGPRDFVTVKPLRCGLATNIVAYSDQGRHYDVIARSLCADESEGLDPRTAYTSRLRFYYPKAIEVEISELAERERAAEPAIRIGEVSLEDLDFEYRWERVRGRKVPWRPREIFNDGERTYIRLRGSPSELPVLLVEGRGIVDYTVEGNVLVVASVLDGEAHLVLGSGRRKRGVRIYYEGGGGS